MLDRSVFPNSCICQLIELQTEFISILSVMPRIFNCKDWSRWNNWCSLLGLRHYFTQIYALKLIEFFVCAVCVHSQSMARIRNNSKWHRIKTLTLISLSVFISKCVMANGTSTTNKTIHRITKKSEKKAHKCGKSLSRKFPYIAYFSHFFSVTYGT